MNFLWAGNYLHSIYNYLYSICIVFGLISNWEMVSSMWEDVCRLYVHTMPLYIRDLRIHGFWNPSPLWDIEGWPNSLRLFLSTAFPAFYPTRQASPSTLQGPVTTLSSTGWVWALPHSPPSWGGELRWGWEKGHDFQILIRSLNY